LLAAASVLAGFQLLSAGAAHAERSIQITNDTKTGFWVMALNRANAGRELTYGGTSHHVLPGETTQLACGGEGCDLLLGRAPGTSGPSFSDVQADCIRVTTYNASRANAAYAACK
jgi:hypothetical protein